jgi:hypothetical protein
MNPSQKIDQMIEEFPDWRGKMLKQLRKIINDTDPDLTEDWKWGTAVWTQDGLVCALGAFKNHVKINFFSGAFIKDTHGIFNAGLDAKTMRSIDFHEGDLINKPALQELVHKAVAYNKVK